jgi:hypothetical protein
VNQVAQGEVQRATAVVERVLTRAGNEGERAVSWARIILGGIIAIAWPLVTYDEMIHGEISDWIVVDCSLVAVVFSVGIIRWLRTHDVTPSLRTISIVVDGVIVLGVLSSFVLNPPPSWLGIGRASIVGIAYFAILAVGLRVSRRGVITALLLFAVGIGCLMAIDDARNAKDDTIANRVTIAALLVNAAVYAWLVAKRTRTLVLEGAAQTSLAERALARLGSYLSEEIAAHALANDTIHMGGVRQDVAIPICARSRRSLRRWIPSKS